jgi:UDP-N-acetyl-D-glucosamine dehydrogenase
MQNSHLSPRTAAIIGLGYVGLPLALEFAKAGIRVIGFDINHERVQLLNQGKSYVDDISDNQLQSAIRTGNLTFTTEASKLNPCEVISISVPTPLRASRDPDTSAIESAMDHIVRHVGKGALVILESTTYPGTTRELVANRLTAEGLIVGKDVFVAFSPERVDPGNAKFGVRNTPKVVGGMTPACLEKALSFYRGVIDQVVPVGNPEEAELVKLLENTFRAVNIALVNEFAMLADRMGIDIWNVIEGAKSKPFGFMPFYPGPGIGGHCIPLDPVYLGWKAKSFDFYSRFIETASDINANMPRVVLQKLSRFANSKGILLKDANIVVGGIAYKANIRDARESPANEVIRLLQNEALAKVSFVDPMVPNEDLHHLPKGIQQMTLEQAVESKPDVFILITPHSSVEWEKIARSSRLVFDTRNAIKKDSAHPAWIKL